MYYSLTVANAPGHQNAFLMLLLLDTAQEPGCFFKKNLDVVIAYLKHMKIP